MSNKRNRLGVALVIIAEMLIIALALVIGGCFDWMHLTFDFTKLCTITPIQRVDMNGNPIFYQILQEDGTYINGDPAMYIPHKEIMSNALQNGLLNSLMIFAGLIGSISLLVLNNKKFLEKLDMYLFYYKFKTKSFERYINEEINIKNKKEAMRAYFNRRIERLDKHKSFEYKRNYEICKDMPEEEFLEYKPMVKAKFINWLNKLIHTFNPYKAKERSRYSFLCKWYCYRKRMFVTYRSDEWIENNWEYSSIKYPKVNTADFKDDLGIGTKKESEWKISNRVGPKGLLTGLRAIVTALLSGAILAVLLVDPSSNEFLELTQGMWGVIMRYITRTASMIMSFCLGCWNGYMLFKSEYVTPADNKIRILSNYHEWQLETHEEIKVSEYEKYIKAKEEAEKAIKESKKQAEEAKTLTEKLKETYNETIEKKGHNG